MKDTIENQEQKLINSLAENNRTNNGLISQMADPTKKDGNNLFGVTSSTREEGTGNEMGLPKATIAHASEVDSDIVHQSAPTNLITDTVAGKEYNNSIFKSLPKDDEVSGEVKELLLKTRQNEESGRQEYIVARHFAQTSNRKGAVIYVPHFIKGRGETTINIEFENGLYSTTNVQIVNALQEAINRKAGAGAVIQEISQAHYAQILSSERQAKRLRTIGGLVNTADISPATGGKSAIDLKNENEKLQRELLQQQELVKQLQADAIKDTNAGLFNKQ